MPLPSPLAFLSSLFKPSTFSTSSDTPLASETKPILLTLHCLFPSDLLPALDLLDRCLVTRFVRASPIHEPSGASPIRHREEEEGEEGEEDGAVSENKEDESAAAAVYYVRSSQRSRFSGTTAAAGATGRNYEVRLRAWNCSCPAFAFAAFRPRDEDTREDWANHDEGDDGEGVRMNDGFGGLALGEREVPVCKHLLACLLVEMGGVLGDLVNQRIAGKEEMAGWAAGFGG